MDIIDYNPVCLNSLLYRMESDTAKLLSDIPARVGDAAVWRKIAPL